MKLNSKICIILIMAITIMSLLSCVLHPEDENHHQSIRIRNNSSKTIYIYSSRNMVSRYHVYIWYYTWDSGIP